MRLPLYQVDAFTGRVFGGNPVLRRSKSLGSAPREVLRAPGDYLAVFESEGDVRALAPSMERVAALDAIEV